MFSSITYLALLSGINVRESLSFVNNFGAPCEGGAFFGFPTWYKFLDGQRSGGECVPKISALSDIWLIILAVVEILIRLAAIAAIVYIIYAGSKYITSRGNPEKTASARTAIQDALIGLIIAVVAIAVVNFVGNSFK